MSLTLQKDSNIQIKPATFLSKSDFLKYQCCASYLWLWKYKKDVVPPDDEEAIKRRREQGNEIEAYARTLFADAVLIKAKGAQARAETERAIEEGAKTIFQATVVTDNGLLAMADVMTFDNTTQTWTLYEVKSTNSIKNEHIYDVSFQCVAFEEAGYKIDKVKIIHLNKNYVRRTEIVAEDLLIVEDVTDHVFKLLPTIKQQIHDALEVLMQTDEPTRCSCRLKTRSGHCPTFHYLNPEIPEYSVFNISRIGTKKLAVLVDGEIFNINDIPEDIKLTVIQQNQVNCAKTKTPIINSDEIKVLLSDAEYPLYFLDYETVSTAIPLYNGCTPYQQIPFQYSLHVVQSSGEVSHFEYLSRSAAALPAEELLDSLSKHISANGSVIVWHKSFEANRNSEMGSLYPKYSGFMADINSRMLDLEVVFSKQHYVHHDFNGSSSIKSVLPVLVPEFSYSDIEIHNGLTASIRWYEAVTGEMTDEGTESTYKALLEYCCLDTLAMVEIYKYLEKL